MRKQKIVNETGPHGEIICRFDNKKTDLNDLTGAGGCTELFYKIDMILERFKEMTEIFKDDEERYRVLLSALIHHAEYDLGQMEAFLERANVQITFMSDKDGCFPGYIEEEVEGVVICFSNKEG